MWLMKEVESSTTEVNTADSKEKEGSQENEKASVDQEAEKKGSDWMNQSTH